MKKMLIIQAFVDELPVAKEDTYQECKVVFKSISRGTNLQVFVDETFAFVDKKRPKLLGGAVPVV